MRLAAIALIALLLAPAAVAKTVTVETMRTGNDDAPFAFSPANVQIDVGDTVRWVNADGVFHTTTSQDGIWDETLASEGASFEFTFDEAGTFDYRCNPHATFMTGSVQVGEGGKETPSQESPGPLALLPILGALLLMRRR